jgi:hypothetical protein
MAACPLLDDLFDWAARQDPNNQTRVSCSLATNQSAGFQDPENAVTYAGASKGFLIYSHADWHEFRGFKIYIPAAFSATLLPQYVSSRERGGDPFDPSRKDALDITISSPGRLPGGSYSVSIRSPEWGSTQSFTPQCEAGLIYGTFLNSVLMVIGLSQPESVQHP